MGHYCYNSSRPHGVSRVQSTACTGTEDDTYHYDNWGNMTSDALRTITYSDFDKAESITKSGKTTTFAYDTGRSRYERITDLTPEGENTATQQRPLYFGNVERIYKRDSKTAPWAHT